jgi:hypothetical protein
MNKMISNVNISCTLYGDSLTKANGKIVDIDELYMLISGICDPPENVKEISFIILYKGRENQYQNNIFTKIKINYLGEQVIGINKYEIIEINAVDRDFLRSYLKDTKQSALHYSHQAPKPFEIAFSLSSQKLSDHTTKYKYVELFKEILLKLNLENSVFGKLNLKRIYFGSEFCPRLLPSADELSKVLDKTMREGLELTYVTSLLYEEDNNIQFDLVDLVDLWSRENNKITEIVINNWGMYQYASKKENLIIVLGRNLVKLKRDPRFEYNNSVFKHEDQLRIGEMDISLYRKFLKDKNIKSIEIDPLPQGIQDDLYDESFTYTLHFPYYVVSFSRNCLLGFLNRDPETIFDFKKSCQQECEKYHYKVSWWDDYINSLKGCTSTNLQIKGRGLFGFNKNWHKEFDFNNIYDKNIRRIIFHIDPPR